MGRKVTRLTVDHLRLLPGGCGTCLAWELDPVRRDRVPDTERLAEKEAWVSEVLREWGSCGRVILIDDRIAGFVLYAPPAYVPGSDAFATAPVSPDAVLLVAAYVAPDQRGGLGRMLVQAMARDLLGRGVRAVEAYGSHCERPCVLPAGFLGGVGFKTQRAHGTTPRMRMDLRTALTWRSEVGAAVERLVGAVRPPSVPTTPRTRGVPPAVFRGRPHEPPA